MDFDFSAKNKAVSRKGLDFLSGQSHTPSDIEPVRNLVFSRILGVSDFWSGEEGLQAGSLMSGVLTGLARHGVSFAFALAGGADGTKVFIGYQKPMEATVTAGVRAAYPGADIITCAGANPLEEAACSFGGLFTGLPSEQSGRGSAQTPIDAVVRGMHGSRFSYLILAGGLSGLLVTLARDRLQDELEAVYPLLSRSVSGGAQGNLSVRQQDYSAKTYFESLNLLDRELKSGASGGLWRVGCCYGADTPEDSRRLAGLIRSSFTGDDSKPDNMRTVECLGMEEVIHGLGIVREPDPQSQLHPLGRWQANDGRTVELHLDRFQTIMSSARLGMLCGLPTFETAGYHIDAHVEFDTRDRLEGERSDPVGIGQIISASSPHEPPGSSNTYLIDKDDLTRHALIVGITGAGKTNTSKSLLTTLWTGHRVPFLVIESAKREYWELRNVRGFEDLRVFTLGDESSRTGVPYRMNPFEANPGVSLLSHIDYLLAAFKAAFDMYPPAPYVLEQAVHEIYSDRGWDTVENVNVLGLKEYPTLSDLRDKVDVVVERLGYSGEINANVKAALTARITSLMIGGKGMMLNTPVSVPVGGLLTRPAVLELEDLGDDESKSFVMGILLVQLFEHRKAAGAAARGKLGHVLLVEEAHRLLRKVSGSGEDEGTKARAVEFFSNMLAEIRTYGQGIIISDQIPTKLATDTVKNTNLKIVHRTVAQDDREMIGHAMNMTDPQTLHLSSLRRGTAAVHSEGDNRPKLVRMPLVEETGTMDRSGVVAESRETSRSLVSAASTDPRRHAGCSFCENRCEHFEEISKYLLEKVDAGKAASRLKESGLRASSIRAFMDSGPMAGLDLGTHGRRVCAVGAVLEKCAGISAGRRKAALAGYLDLLRAT